MIKLLLSDMDGTLLPFGATTVSQRTHEAILAAQQAGIHFGPASGRDRAAQVHPRLRLFAVYAAARRKRLTGQSLASKLE